MSIAIIDYYSCNITSIYSAVYSLGARVEVVHNPKNLKKYSKIILPGVGAAPSVMKNLHKNGYIDEIKDFNNSQKPILGICIGMQILFNKLYEKGINQGFGFFKSDVISLKSKNMMRVNMGWKEIRKVSDLDFDSKINKKSFYFCHSFFANIIGAEEKFIKYQIEDMPSVPCIVSKDNILGFQFHPEKSQGVGLQLLENFIFKS